VTTVTVANWSITTGKIPEDGIATGAIGGGAGAAVVLVVAGVAARRGAGVGVRRIGLGAVTVISGSLSWEKPSVASSDMIPELLKSSMRLNLIFIISIPNESPTSSPRRGSTTVEPEVSE
jgi:hypothetical protein